MTASIAEVAAAVLVTADQAILVYFLALNSFYALLLILSVPELWKHSRVADDENLRLLRGSDAIPAVSLLVPAYNEAATIADSLLSFLTLEYPRHEVIVVNDGSRDDTIDRLIAAYDLYQVPPAFPALLPTQTVHAYYRSRRYSKLLCIDKANGGKADALNAALNAARFPYVLAVDADTIIEPDALLRMARPFLLGVDVAAVGGTIRVANGSRVEHSRVVDARVSSRPLAGLQTVEYLRAFLFGRLGWNRLGGNLIISGAFGLFNRAHLLEIGGYTTGSVTEDMDLVVRLHRYLRDNGIAAKLPFIPDPVAWTEVPSSIHVLSRQRERWHRGLIATVVAHRDLLFKRRYGPIGLVAFPFFVFGEMAAPLVEVLGYLGFAAGIAFGLIDVGFAVLFLAVALGFGLLLSLWAIVLEEISFRRYHRSRDFLKMLLFTLLEPFGYRQLTVLFRVKAFWMFFRRHQGWGEMTRQGFSSSAR